MTGFRAVLAEQLAANQSSRGERARFAGHRARLTELCERATAGEGAPSLCVLGAGNANDLELARLATRYRAIHLVDVDADALGSAVAGESAETQARLVCHAPIDLSGLFSCIERWQRLELTPDELVRHPAETASALASRLGGPFDVVLSACLLTQMQLGVLSVLGERHPLFEAVRYTLTLTHLRTLSALTKPGGSVLFVSDLSATEFAPAIATAEERELAPLVDTLVQEGRVFQVAQPALLRDMAREDPTLSADLELAPALEAWRWQNGPAQTFLVYALEGRRLRSERKIPDCASPAHF